MRINTLIIAVYLFSFSLLTPLSAYACSCLNPGAPCQAYWKSDAVFSGEIADISTVPVNREIMPGRTYTFFIRKVRIKINEAFRGISGDSVEILTGAGGGDCGYSFKLGQSYLVYAYKNSETGELGTSICNRTQPLEKALDDLAYFRGLPAAPSGSKIYGTVSQMFARRNADPYKPPARLAGIQVMLTGSAGNVSTVTDEKGEYRFDKMPAGEYEISLLPPVGLVLRDAPQKVKTYDKGCAGGYFSLSTKTSVSGRLLNEYSEPAANIGVNLVPVEQVNASAHPDLAFSHTDKNGNFSFHFLPDGKYYLGVRLSGINDKDFLYPQTFYPGTPNLSKARVITVNEGQIMENLDFKLPAKHAFRRVEGIVVYPDGTPAVNAGIGVNEVEYFYSHYHWGAAQTKADGTFSFQLVDGIRYLAKPVVAKDGQQSHAEPIEIPASGDVTNLKFVITEPNGNCRKCYNWTRP